MPSNGIALRIGWFFQIDHDWRFLSGSEGWFLPDANNGFPQTAHITSCSKIKNPKPLPIGNKFGFLKYGGASMTI